MFWSKSVDQSYEKMQNFEAKFFYWSSYVRTFFDQYYQCGCVKKKEKSFAQHTSYVSTGNESTQIQSDTMYYTIHKMQKLFTPQNLVNANKTAV